MTDTQAPERIWAECPRVGYGTWHHERRDYDVAEYVRADIHAAVVAERDQLKAEMKEIMRHCPDKATRLKACKALEKNDG